MSLLARILLSALAIGFALAALGYFVFVDQLLFLVALAFVVLVLWARLMESA